MTLTTGARMQTAEPATNPPEPSPTYDCDGCGTTTLQDDLYDLPRAPQGAAVFSLCCSCAAEDAVELLRNPRGDKIPLHVRAVAVQAIHDYWQAESRELNRLEREDRERLAAAARTLDYARQLQGALSAGA